MFVFSDFRHSKHRDWPIPRARRRVNVASPVQGTVYCLSHLQPEGEVPCAPRGRRDRRSSDGPESALRVRVFSVRVLPFTARRPRALFYHTRSPPSGTSPIIPLGGSERSARAR